MVQLAHVEPVSKIDIPLIDQTEEQTILALKKQLEKEKKDHKETKQKLAKASHKNCLYEFDNQLLLTKNDRLKEQLQQKDQEIQKATKNFEEYTGKMTMIGEARNKIIDHLKEELKKKDQEMTAMTMKFAETFLKNQKTSEESKKKLEEKMGEKLIEKDIELIHLCDSSKFIEKNLNQHVRELEEDGDDKDQRIKAMEKRVKRRDQKIEDLELEVRDLDRVLRKRDQKINELLWKVEKLSERVKIQETLTVGQKLDEFPQLESYASKLAKGDDKKNVEKVKTEQKTVELINAFEKLVVGNLVPTKR